MGLFIFLIVYSFENRVSLKLQLHAVQLSIFDSER